MPSPLLIATADVHLSKGCPSFRSTEPDWMWAQRRQLRWLKKLQQELECPIVIAGDVFNRVEDVPGLINLVIDELPVCYAVAGNHDLPSGGFDHMNESCYGVLVKANRINDIDGVVVLDVKGTRVALHGFPYGSQYDIPCKKYGDMDIAIVHETVWSPKYDIPGADFMKPEFTVDGWRKIMPGYDFYLFGHFHKPFEDGNVINCGSFFRRTTTEAEYIPSVVVIYDDFTFGRINVPTDEDKYMRSSDKIKNIKGDEFGDFAELFESLKHAETLVCDVDELLREFLAGDMNTDVKNAILDITKSGDT